MLVFSHNTAMDEKTSVEVIEASVFNLSTMQRPRKGGFRAAMFIFAMSGLENVGFVALMVSLVEYFMYVMHFDIPGSATTLTNFAGSTFLLTVLGGFISDTYMTRLNTVLFFGLLEILGYVLLTMQAHDKQLEPNPTCSSCHLGGKSAYIFYFTLSLLALGFGGVRGCVPSLGADQFDKNHPKEKKHLTSYFNWFLLSVTTGATLGVTIVVWVSTQKSWSLGFFISTLLSLLGFGFVAIGRPFYRVRVPGDSPLLRILQVIVVAIRNRKMEVPESCDELYEIDEKEEGQYYVEEKIPRSTQFRFLDKAAVLGPDGSRSPWTVCTITQVEEVKILIRMLPILCSTILMNTCMAQLQTFSVQQGNFMDRRLSDFNVPASSIPVFPLLFMSILLPLYELLFVPLARRLTGQPTGISHLQRVGFGLLLSAASMAVAAHVEAKRRAAFYSPAGPRLISLFWLAFQYGIFGIADMFTLVGLMEFFYSQAPTGMRSLATSFAYLSLSFGFFLSSVVVHSINGVTRRVTKSKQGWLHGLDLNQDHLDLFYWFLAILSCLNFVVYLLCAKWYKYRSDSGNASTADDRKVQY